jgi:Leucine Rich repeat
VSFLVFSIRICDTPSNTPIAMSTYNGHTPSLLQTVTVTDNVTEFIPKYATVSSASMSHKSTATPAIKTTPSSLLVHQDSRSRDEMDQWDLVFGQDDEAQITTVPMFDRLPESLVASVLRFLDTRTLLRKVAILNRHLNRQVNKPTAWTQFDFRMKNAPMEEASALLSKWCKSGRLRLVKSVRLNAANISGACFRDLIENCPNIQSLRVANARHVTDSSLQGLYMLAPFEWRTNLIHRASLKMPSRSSSRDSLAISSTFVKDAAASLVHTDQHEAKFGHDDCDSPNSRRTVELMYFRSLAHLKHIEFGLSSITNRGLELISNGCPHLKSAVFNVCSKIDTEGLTVLIQRCSNIERLSFVGCRWVTPDTIRAIASHLPGLKALCLSACFHVDSEAMQIIADGLPQLECLELGSCRQIDDDGIALVLESCTSLRELDLSNTDIGDDTVVRIFGGSLPGLKRLNLASCSSIEGKWTTKDIAGENPHHLRKMSLDSVSLYYWKKVEDNAFSALLPALHSVKLLVMTAMNRISAPVFARAFLMMPQLESIDLSYCLRVDDAALSVLSRFAPRMFSLNATFCPNISAVGVQSVLHHAPQLKHLTLSYTPADLCNGFLGKADDSELLVSDFESDRRRLLQISMHTPELNMPTLLEFDEKHDYNDHDDDRLPNNLEEEDCIEADIPVASWPSPAVELGQVQQLAAAVRVSSLGRQGNIQAARRLVAERERARAFASQIQSSKRSLLQRFLSVLQPSQPRGDGQYVIDEFGDVQDAVATQSNSRPGTAMFDGDIDDTGIEERYNMINDTTNVHMLETLNLYCSPEINNQTVRAIARRFPHLRKLVLSGCSKVSTSGFKALANSCHRLQSIACDGCAFGRRALEALERGCPNLDLSRKWMMLEGRENQPNDRDNDKRCAIM